MIIWVQSRNDFTIYKISWENILSHSVNIEIILTLYGKGYTFSAMYLTTRAL